MAAHCRSVTLVASALGPMRSLSPLVVESVGASASRAPAIASVAPVPARSEGGVLTPPLGSGRSPSSW